MPYALVLHCHTQNGVISPEDLQGQKTLALFLQELIQKQDPALATMLHAPKNSKPFTTAILQPLGPNGLGRPENKRPAHRSKANHGDQGEMKMRLTLLDDALYPLISQFFLQHVGGIPRGMRSTVLSISPTRTLFDSEGRVHAEQIVPGCPRWLLLLAEDQGTSSHAPGGRGASQHCSRGVKRAGCPRCRPHQIAPALSVT